MTDLTGHVAVVTGGNRGIGLGLAHGLVAAGATVAVWARDEERTAAACAELGRAVGVRCDVADEAQVVAAMAQTLAELGKVDSVFANAGVGGLAPFVDMSLAEWRRVMAVNLDGAFLTLREGARHLVERGEGGSLVAVSSVSAIHGAPHQQHYAASKTAAARPGARPRRRAGPSPRPLQRHPPGLDRDRDDRARQGQPALGRRHHPAHAGASVGRARPTSGRSPPTWPIPTLLFHTGDSIVVDGGYSIF